MPNGTSPNEEATTGSASVSIYIYIFCVYLCLYILCLSISPVSIPLQTEWSMPSGTTSDVEDVYIFTYVQTFCCKYCPILPDGVVHAERNILGRRRSHDREVITFVVIIAV